MTRKVRELYKTNTDLSVPARMAEFLDYRARMQPGRPVSLRELAQVAYALPRLPNENSKEVKQVRGRVSAAKKILIERYNRTMQPHPGYGYRATTDSEDIADFALEKAARRVVSAGESLDRTRSLITLSDITNQAKRRRVEEIGRATRILISGDVLDRLRLPEKSDPEKK